ncbi:hypothetical protein QMK19_36975 [Streptomyces sp. H10-C2]|uniref:hypothetical protein n=1 Tax=unclassified Streptomyces TaxID=2593676 RepID=UPI0024BB0D14|nr:MULTISPECIES: hypothetical protein [unclassified Streptomyces]MDJ0347095.1 hypothetical protein [Streptomyces sp. PH10-H1]MDJ0375058.1 hypothetical protein [Streptomyces sp. H10-C2]
MTFASDNTTLVFTLSPIRFGGPGATAARLDSTYQGVQVNGYLAVEKLGPVVMVYFFYQVGSGSSQLASQYYRQAVTKAQRVLGTAGMRFPGPISAGPHNRHPPPCTVTTLPAQETPVNKAGPSACATANLRLHDGS